MPPTSKSAPTGPAKRPAKKTKWVRQTLKKGSPVSAKKQNRRPSLSGLIHQDGTAVFYSAKTDKNGYIVEYYSLPMRKLVEEDSQCRDFTGIYDVMLRRGRNGFPLPQCPNSHYGWNCFVQNLGIDATNEDLRRQLQLFVDYWNSRGDDTAIFRYHSHVDLGNCNDPADLLTLDHTLLDEDVVEIIKVSYGIKLNDQLASLAEEDDIVGLYFENVRRGKDVLLRSAAGL